MNYRRIAAQPLAATALVVLLTASAVVEAQPAATNWSPDAWKGREGVMTRREAREQIRPERFVQSMRRVVFDQRRRASLVEEAPSAYRDIRDVLEDEADLVRPVVRLEPIAVLKG